jgi:hypothetical protein
MFIFAMLLFISAVLPQVNAVDVGVSLSSRMIALIHNATTLRRVSYLKSFASDPKQGKFGNCLRAAEIYLAQCLNYSGVVFSTANISFGAVRAATTQSLDVFGLQFFANASACEKDVSLLHASECASADERICCKVVPFLFNSNVNQTFTSVQVRQSSDVEWKSDTCDKSPSTFPI